MKLNQESNIDEYLRNIDAREALRQGRWMMVEENPGNVKYAIGFQDQMAKKIFDIEYICKELVISKDSPLLLEKNINKPWARIQKTPLAMKILKLLMFDRQDFVNAYPCHRFNPQFELFMKMKPEIDLRQPWLMFKRSELEEVEQGRKVINEFSAKLRNELLNEDFKKLSDRFRRSGLKNNNSLKMYYASCFKKRSNLLIIRPDLSYKSGVEHDFSERSEFSVGAITFNDLMRHRALFFARVKAIYKKGLIGFVWRLEYGTEKCFHFHCLIFLDSALHQADVLIAKTLGEYWKKEITGGLGNYHNCNAVKHKYSYQMLGKVRVDNLQMWQGLDFFAAYVTYPDMYVKLNLPGRHRALGKGGTPKFSIVKVGRPLKLSKPPQAIRSFDGKRVLM